MKKQSTKKWGVLALLLLATNLGHAADVYVATTGSNSNKGTIDSPYKTIAYAVGKMSSGDVCYIREGIYREKVTLSKGNITLSAYEDEFVGLYGTTTLSGWENYKGEIYKTKLTGVESNVKFTQVIHQGKMQKMARYPDHTTDDMFSIEDESGYIGLEVKKNGEVVFDEALPGAANSWAGGYFRAISAKAGATNPNGRVKYSNGKNVVCEDISEVWSDGSWKTIGEGKGYIFHLNALTRAGEWYYQDGYLYYWQPGGGKPADGEVEAQRYEHVILATSKSNITLRNLNIRAAAIKLEKCTGSKIEGCTFRDIKGWIYRKSYSASYTELGGVHIKNGSDTSFKDCYFAGSWGNLLCLEKSDEINIDNCIFENNGWMGFFTSSIQSNSDNMTLTNSTLGSTGRFHIRTDGHARMDVLHNDFSDCMKMCQDAGSIELTNTIVMPAAMDMKGSQFAYNKFHDMNTLPAWTKNTQFVVALYFEGADNYTVHHNLFYNITNSKDDGSWVYLGPRMSVIEDCYYYNNTVWNIDCRIRIWNYTSNGSTGKINNMLMYNNIFESGMRNEWGNLQSQITMADNKELPYSQGTSHFIDPTNGNFQLQSNSSLKDAGRVIKGITDGYKGSAPDLGCYEQGVEPWNCGSTLKIGEFPDESEEGLSPKQKQITILLK